MICLSGPIRLSVLHRCLRVVLLLSALSGAQPTSPPTTASAPAGLENRLAGLVRDLPVLAEAPDERELVRSALDSLRQALLEPLRKRCQSDDLEVRTRSRKTLQTLYRRLRIRRVALLLPAGLQDRLERFGARYPALMGDVFSDDLPRRVRAVRALSDMDDPDALAEPLLVLCLNHPSVELAAWAAQASARPQYGHPMLVQALCRIVVRTSRQSRRHTHVHRDGEQNDDPPDLQQAVIEALRSLRSPAAARPLMEAIEEFRPFDMDEMVLVAETLGASRNVEVVPDLIGRLKPGSSYTRTVDGNRYTFSRSDAYLLALLRLTGQGLTGYELLYVPSPHGHRTNFGFDDDDARKRAIRKFKAWWTGPKGQAFRDRRQPATPTSRPETDSDADAPGTVELTAAQRVKLLDRVQALAGELRTRATVTLAGFEHEHFRARRQAMTHYLRLADALGGSLSDSSLAREFLSDWIVQIRVQRFSMRLNETQKRALQNLLQNNTSLLADSFSFRPRRRIAAIEWITEHDSAAAAEMLVIQALGSEVPYLQSRAIRAVRTGRYRSDRLVDLLTGLALDELDRKRIAYWNPNDNSLPMQALLGLKQIGSPRPAHRLLQVLDKQNPFAHLGVLEDTLVACADESILPGLVEKLQSKSTGMHTTRRGHMKLTITKNDRPLRILLRLTRQDPEEYGFVFMDKGKPFERYGFADRKTRKQAVAKFMTWWEANKHKTLPGSEPPTSTQPAGTTHPAPAASTRSASPG